MRKRINTNKICFVASLDVSPRLKFQGKASSAIRVLSRSFVGAILIALASIVATAQDTSPTAPIQIISKSQFNQMVKNGQLAVTSPEVVLGQYLQTWSKDLENGLVVDEFIRQNPSLPGFAQMVALTPTKPNVFPTIDGDYRTVITNAQGVTQVIETNGQGEKLAGLARSILASSDPVQQLSLYESLYSQYATLFNQLCIALPVGTSDTTSPPGCANLTLPSALPSPSALKNGSMEVIQSALQSIGSQAPNLLHLLPPSEGVVGLGCSGEIGASIVADNVFFGDQTGSSGCAASTPSPTGILSNFNWPNKNLLSCVKNQGARGLCHIFAATSALEELIARDTGNVVNLSEQDFTEHEKLIWGPAFFHDGGDAYDDLQNAAGYNYRFAYENQWDYNPSLSQPSPPADEFFYSCNNYPSTEPGCSWSTPQAPNYCTPNYAQCGFTPVMAPGANSPYGSNGAVDVWNPKNPGLSVNYIQLALAFNNAVILGFNVTNAFQGSRGGYVCGEGLDLLSSIGGHAVHIVGYVSNSDLASNSGTENAPPAYGGGYFIIKNSWGKCTGDAGYYYMPVFYLEAEASEVLIVSSESNN